MRVHRHRPSHWLARDRELEERGVAKPHKKPPLRQLVGESHRYTKRWGCTTSLTSGTPGVRCPWFPTPEGSIAHLTIPHGRALAVLATSVPRSSPSCWIRRSGDLCSCPPRYAGDPCAVSLKAPASTPTRKQALLAYLKMVKSLVAQ